MLAMTRAIKLLIIELFGVLSTVPSLKPIQGYYVRKS